METSVVNPSLDNTMTFTLYSSEFLPATIGGNGWNVLVRKNDNTELMNGGNLCNCNHYQYHSVRTVAGGYKIFQYHLPP